MAKDKLITVRIKQDLYDSFKAWTESRNSNISDTLRSFILNCLNGTDRQNIDIADSGNNEDTLKKLEVSLYEKLYNQLYNDLSSHFTDNVYSKTDNGLSSQKIVNDIDNSLSSQNIDSSIDNDSLTDTQNKDVTESIALLELPILPVNVDSEVIVPNEEKSDNNSDIPLIDNKIKTFEDAIKKILELKSEGKTNTAIAKELTGKYHTAKGMTDWKDIQVKRILQKLENNCTDTEKT